MRGRIRSVKPEIALDEALWDLGQETGLPVYQAFTMLWCYSDKDGRFEWRPRALKTECLPYWDGDFESVLDALARVNFVVRYRVEGKDYGYVRNFKRHQLLNGKEPPSSLPAPPAPPASEADAESSSDSIGSHVSDACPTRESHVSDACPTRLSSSPSQSLPVPSPTQGGGAGGGSLDLVDSGTKVPCPPAADLLTREQRAALEVALIPGWAIDAIAAEFAARYAADQSERRTLVRWRKGCAQAVAGNWNNPNRRPQKPDATGSPPIALKGGAVQRTGESFVAKYRAEQAAKSGDAA